MSTIFKIYCTGEKNLKFFKKDSGVKDVCRNLPQKNQIS